jgi:hypothetical protein
MARLIVTPEALALIQECIEAEEVRSPVVAVAWSKGAADLRRGAVGEVVWEREAPGWKASVLDLDELAEAGVAWTSPIVELYGYKFSLFGKPESPQLEGCTLTAKGGKLVVDESAT